MLTGKLRVLISLGGYVIPTLIQSHLSWGVRNKSRGIMLDEKCVNMYTEGGNVWLPFLPLRLDVKIWLMMVCNREENNAERI